MRSLRNVMVTFAATAALLTAVGCDDEAPATESDGSAGAGGAGNEGGGGAGGAGNEGGGGAGAEGGEGGAGNEGGGGAGAEGGEGGEGGGGEGGGGAGGDGGSVVVPEDDTCAPADGGQDTAAAPEPGEYGPSAIVISLDAPNTPEAAIAAGCNLYGASRGSALAGAEELATGTDNLNSLVEPDENGDVTVLLIAQLLDVLAGDTGNSRLNTDIAFYTGERDAEGALLISRSSFVSEDPANEPLIKFEDACTANSQLRAPGADFALSLPVIDGLPPLELTLNQTRFNGGLAFNADGFAISEGVLRGYLTRDTLILVIDALNTACAAPNPPSLCETIAPFLGGDPDQTITLLLGLLALNGFDVEIGADNQPKDCAAGGPTCNAIGVCLQVELRASKVVGVAPAAE